MSAATAREKWDPSRETYGDYAKRTKPSERSPRLEGGSYDDAPQPDRITTSDGSSGSSSPSTRRSMPSVPRFITRAPRRVLVAELVAAVTLRTVTRVSNGDTPTLQDYVPVFVVYLILGFAAETSEELAHLAAGLGGLVLLAIAMNAAPGIVKATSALGAPRTTPTAPTGGGPSSSPPPSAHHPNGRPGKHRGNKIGG